jgi:hypothetical protein
MFQNEKYLWDKTIKKKAVINKNVVALKPKIEYVENV